MAFFRSNTFLIKIFLTLLIKLCMMVKRLKRDGYLVLLTGTVVGFTPYRD